MSEIAKEEWVRERWGGFNYLLIGRNEDFIILFQAGQLLLRCEIRNRVSDVLLIENPTQQSVIEVERLFGC